MRAHAHLPGLELPWRRPARLGTPRLLARLRAPWLDRELARGVESWRSGPCYRRTSPLALRDALVALDAALDVPD
jgi:hypothetical protein